MAVTFGSSEDLAALIRSLSSMPVGSVYCFQAQHAFGIDDHAGLRRDYSLSKCHAKR